VSLPEGACHPGGDRLTRALPQKAEPCESCPAVAQPDHQLAAAAHPEQLGLPQVIMPLGQSALIVVPTGSRKLMPV
jgi:hypothetical protein